MANKKKFDLTKIRSFKIHKNLKKNTEILNTDLQNIKIKFHNKKYKMKQANHQSIT